MSRYVTSKQKAFIANRANFRCEYCCLPDIDSYYGFHADHIISWRHGGLSVFENLAYCCPDCNRNKGTDLGSILDISDKIIRFFNPRVDIWGEHFQLLNTGFIEPLTDIGRVTVNFFSFNHPDRIIERQLLHQLNLI